MIHVQQLNQITLGTETKTGNRGRLTQGVLKRIGKRNIRLNCYSHRINYLKMIQKVKWTPVYNFE